MGQLLGMVAAPRARSVIASRATVTVSFLMLVAAPASATGVLGDTGIGVVDDADSNYLDRADVDAVKLTFTPPHATLSSTTRYRPNTRNRTTQSCVSFTSSGALAPS